MCFEGVNCALCVVWDLSVLGRPVVGGLRPICGFKRSKEGTHQKGQNVVVEINRRRKAHRHSLVRNRRERERERERERWQGKKYII